MRGCKIFHVSKAYPFDLPDFSLYTSRNETHTRQRRRGEFLRFSVGIKFLRVLGTEFKKAAARKEIPDIFPVQS